MAKLIVIPIGHGTSSLRVSTVREVQKKVLEQKRLTQFQRKIVDAALSFVVTKAPRSNGEE